MCGGGSAGNYSSPSGLQTPVTFDISYSHSTGPTIHRVCSTTGVKVTGEKCSALVLRERWSSRWRKEALDSGCGRTPVKNTDVGIEKSLDRTWFWIPTPELQEWALDAKRAAKQAKACAPCASSQSLENVSSSMRCTLKSGSHVQRYNSCSFLGIESEHLLLCRSAGQWHLRGFCLTG